MPDLYSGHLPAFREANKMQVILFSMSLVAVLSQTGVLESSKNKDFSCWRVLQHRNGQWGCVTVVVGAGIVMDFLL